MFVTAPQTAPGLHRAQRLHETADVVAASSLPTDHPLPQQPGRRWPWWLALVALRGLMWWVERRWAS